MSALATVEPAAAARIVEAMRCLESDALETRAEADGHFAAAFAASPDLAEAFAAEFAEAADARFSSTNFVGGDAERTELTEAVTAFVEKAADDAFHAWRDVFLRLFAATRDGFAFGAPSARRCPPPPAPRAPGCTSRLVPSAREVGYDARWRARVAADGDNAAHYEVPEEKAEDEDAARDAEARAAWKRARMEKKRPGPGSSLASLSGSRSRSGRALASRWRT